MSIEKEYIRISDETPKDDWIYISDQPLLTNPGPIWNVQKTKKWTNVIEIMRAHAKKELIGFQINIFSEDRDGDVLMQHIEYNGNGRKKGDE